MSRKWTLIVWLVLSVLWATIAFAWRYNDIFGTRPLTEREIAGLVVVFVAPVMLVWIVLVAINFFLMLLRRYRSLRYTLIILALAVVGGLSYRWIYTHAYLQQYAFEMPLEFPNIEAIYKSPSATEACKKDYVCKVGVMGECVLLAQIQMDISEARLQVTGDEVHAWNEDWEARSEATSKADERRKRIDAAESKLKPYFDFCDSFRGY